MPHSSPTCPHCAQPLTPAEVRALYRATPREMGRPRTDAPRCSCGAYTLARCQARGKSSTHQAGCEWYRSIRPVARGRRS